MDLYEKAEANKLAEGERRHRRQLRISQVRQQTDNWMSNSRARFEEEKARQLRKLIHEVTEVVTSKAVKNLEQLNSQHEMAMKEIGEAHRAAAVHPDTNKLIALKKAENEAKATERFAEAMKQERQERLQKQEEASRLHNIRENIRLKENEKAKLLSERRPFRVKNSDEKPESMRDKLKREGYQQSIAHKLYVPSDSKEKENHTTKIRRPRRKTFKTKRVKPKKVICKSPPCQKGYFAKAADARKRGIRLKIRRKRVHSALGTGHSKRGRRNSDVFFVDSNIPLPPQKYKAPPGLVRREPHDRALPNAWKKAEKHTKAQAKAEKKKDEKSVKIAKKTKERSETALKVARLQQEYKKLAITLGEHEDENVPPRSGPSSGRQTPSPIILPRSTPKKKRRPIPGRTASPTVTKRGGITGSDQKDSGTTPLRLLTLEQERTELPSASGEYVPPEVPGPSSSRQTPSPITLPQSTLKDKRRPSSSSTPAAASKKSDPPKTREPVPMKSPSIPAASSPDSTPEYLPTQTQVETSRNPNKLVSIKQLVSRRPESSFTERDPRDPMSKVNTPVPASQALHGPSDNYISEGVPEQDSPSQPRNLKGASPDLQSRSTQTKLISMLKTSAGADPHLSSRSTRTNLISMVKTSETVHEYPEIPHLSDTSNSTPPNTNVLKDASSPNVANRDGRTGSRGATPLRLLTLEQEHKQLASSPQEDADQNVPPRSAQSSGRRQAPSPSSALPKPTLKQKRRPSSSKTVSTNVANRGEKSQKASGATSLKLVTIEQERKQLASTSGEHEDQNVPPRSGTSSRRQIPAPRTTVPQSKPKNKRRPSSSRTAAAGTTKKSNPRPTREPIPVESTSSSFPTVSLSDSTPEDLSIQVRADIRNRRPNKLLNHYIKQLLSRRPESLEALRISYSESSFTERDSSDSMIKVNTSVAASLVLSSENSMSDGVSQHDSPSGQSLKGASPRSHSRSTRRSLISMVETSEEVHESPGTSHQTETSSGTLANIQIIYNSGSPNVAKRAGRTGSDQSLAGVLAALCARQQSCLNAPLGVDLSPDEYSSPDGNQTIPSLSPFLARMRREDSAGPSSRPEHSTSTPKNSASKKNRFSHQSSSSSSLETGRGGISSCMTGVNRVSHNSSLQQSQIQDDPIPSLMGHLASQWASISIERPPWLEA